MNRITWTKSDEAPSLASYSLLPVVEAYCRAAGIEIEIRDISLAGRIIANFPDNLTSEQKQTDDLAYLGELVKQPEANVIKLPNISASIPQLENAIKELQEKGYNIPSYPHQIKTDKDRKLVERFAAVLGSAVNPVLREGNSDRRPAKAVKQFARKHPHGMVKPWPEQGSKADVAYMQEGDFYGSEQSVKLDKPCNAKIEFIGKDGSRKTLKDSLPLLEGEVADSAVMSADALENFYSEKMEFAKKEGLLLSLHLKATMMKVSDPIMFGHCVKVFLKDVIDKHSETFDSLGVNLNYGLENLFSKLEGLEPAEKQEIESDIRKAYENNPSLAMVDSRKGITNLHVPNNIIIDASMPNVVRDGGKMWNKDDQLQDTLALIPDRSYACIYQQIIEDCKENGQFNPAEMGSVSNVGLMAKKAEEYGSHDKTFEAEADGKIQVLSDAGEVLMSQSVSRGDIFRMCQAKDAPIKSWVELAVTRAREEGVPAVFWLDEERAHDREIIAKVKKYLPEFDTSGLTIEIMEPREAMKYSLKRVRRGENTISVTGNVLRDYLTDLFPILELGTSARMLSIVPLMNGGGLYETGAGGSAPKHVAQFLRENHLRWDSLGEYCALVPSLEKIAGRTGNKKAAILADALNKAISDYLENGKTPLRKAGEPDNRASTYFLAMYWAKHLSEQKEDLQMQERFAEVFSRLCENEPQIIQDLTKVQGSSADIGGYYKPEDKLAEKAMRPSEILNEIIEGV
ncbi:NADP-dependent isocitrate dehydrogenase [Sedimentisphaera salicampi]|uniref:NADP-dependent isocitrate dehydrogenase n=1 Tax=Sedimentisphaera salicampi TaxID=1941349 RepID=UPI000B9C5EB3|nr:NADP-dependent isocitrate dehydrogenase [Sedimentisphaera salicampi]OXU15936.1 Isocitrate dehydrogenase [NADP] 2 [Sedimentisphaera salicampi]